MRFYEALTYGKQPVKSPTAFLLGGQGGSGKSSIHEYLSAEIGNIVSIDGDLFRRTAARYGENIRVLTAVGEGFVELVEEDREQSPEAEEAVRRVLEPMIREGADQIVLGCTHYPFLLPVFRQVIGERGVAVVDPSPAVGRRVGQLLDQYDLRAEKGAAANYGFLTFADEAYRSRLECKAFG